MAYVDGVVIPVAQTARANYLDFARKTAALFRACGAIQVMECWGEDVPEGKLTSFPLAVQLQPGEAVVLSWVMWPDKAAREEGWKKAMADPLMANAGGMPFDGKRMIFGGFEVMLQA